LRLTIAAARRPATAIALDRRRRTAYRVRVTNRIALVLGLVLAALIAADLALGLGGLLFLARRFLVLLDWIAVWR
jgi:hypothetical protein